MLYMYNGISLENKKKTQGYVYKWKKMQHWQKWPLVSFLENLFLHKRQMPILKVNNHNNKSTSIYLQE